jgi:hypothetical protein
MGMVDPVTAVLSGLMVQVYIKTWEAWRAWVGEVPHLNEDEIYRRINDLIVGSESAHTSIHVELEYEENFEGFIRSIDFRELAVEAMTMHLTGNTIRSSSDLARKARLLLMAHGLSLTEATIAADALMERLEQVTAAIAPSNAEEVIKSRKLTKERQREYEAALAHEQQRIHRRLTENLAAIADLLDEAHIDLRALDRTLSLLRRSARHAHSSVVPPSINGSARVEINAIYEPPFLRMHSFFDRLSMPLHFGRLFEDRSNTQASAASPLMWPVILGDPGAGKSTFASWTAWHANGSSTVRDAVAAIVIVLREHSTSIALSGLNIVEAIKSAASNRYQVSLSTSEITYLCSTGRLLLIFDGLDELVDLSRRAAVGTSLESFAVVYPRCPVMVTSRVIGYTDSPLDKNLFETYEIQPFSEDQIRSYVGKWFARSEELPPGARRSLTDSFMDASASITDLRENALLLSLLCGLYKTQEYLPRNRPQIYAECAKMLYDTWNRRKSLVPLFDFDARIQGAVQHLAHWIFTSQDRQAGVSQEELENVAAEYFDEWQYANPVEARRAAHEFVEFCKGRAWILTDVGTRSYRPIFAFTHRTFLEYFTALHYVETMSELELKRFIVAVCGQSTWNMVSQMTVQLAAGKRRGLEDELIRTLHQSLRARTIESQINVATVCVATLRNLPLRPATVKVIAQLSADIHLEAHLDNPRVNVPDRRRAWVGAAALAMENRAAADSQLGAYFARRIRSRRGLSFLMAHYAEYFLNNAEFPLSTNLYFEAPDLQFVMERLYRNRDRAPADVVSAFVLGVDIRRLLPTTPINRATILLGSRFGLDSLEGKWGIHPMPAILESLINFAVIVPQNRLDDFRRTKMPLIQAALLAATATPAVQRGRSYHPHWRFWQNIRTADTGLSDHLNPAEWQDMIGAIGYFCDTYLISRSFPNREDAVRHLLAKDWGNLGAILPLLRRKYLKENAEAFNDPAVGAFKDWIDGEKDAIDTWKEIHSLRR